MLRVSEARLNDIVYLGLKKLFFEPMFGKGVCPRECDIRVCMDLAVSGRMGEPIGKNHMVFEVDSDHVLSVIIDYMENHWMKQSVEDAWNNPKIRIKLRSVFNEWVEIAMQTSEEQCGR